MAPAHELFSTASVKGGNVMARLSPSQTPLTADGFCVAELTVIPPNKDFGIYCAGLWSRKPLSE